MSAGDRDPLLHLQLCPSCDGQPAVRGMCTTCDNTGVLEESGAPFYPPPPFDGWRPANLVRLSQESRLRHERSTAMPQTEEQLTPLSGRRPRLSLSELVEMLIAALARASGEHSTVKLNRNARGDVQIEVSVRTGETGVETVDEAALKARQVYDHLAGLYPSPGSDGKGEGGS